MKKSIILYSISVLMFCFGVYLAQYNCFDSILGSPGLNFCTFQIGVGDFLSPIYPATFIFLSILIAVVTFIKQDDL